MAVPVRWKFGALFAIVFLCISTNAQNVLKSFRYKYSFKPPYLAQKDGSVPFWEYAGNAIANEEMVRVTPSLRSQKGNIWTRLPIDFDWWEVELIFRVTGRGRIGADGLAFWYTDYRQEEGPVFGSADQWNGLGIFFDSFDNDNKHNNPYIMAMTNDGSRNYDHQLDGSSQQLAGCLRDFRNKPFPVRAKIEYYQNTLTVMFHNGMSNNEFDYEMCMRIDNIILPKNGYFGVSAATGGLADDHDVLKFLTHSLHGPESAVSENEAGVEEEREKLAKEYEEYQEKLRKQKTEYREANPDAAKDNDMDNPEEWFETDSQRELGQIFSGQSKMFDSLREIQKKLDEIVGRQERSLGLLSAVQTNQGQQTAQVVGGQAVPVDTIRRHEVDIVLANQREMTGAAREIKAYVTEIHQRSATILQNQNKQQQNMGTAQVQAIGTDSIQSNLNEIKEGLNMIRRDISATAQRLAAQPTCPASQPCLSTTVFIVFIVGQLVVMIGYFIYRDNKEAQAKKFY